MKNIKYIGERVHVLKDKEKQNGLFGVINGEFFNDKTTGEICDRVFEISQKHITMFRSVISFTPERADMLELGTDKSRWENYVRKSIRTIGESNNIDVCGLEWVAAVHNKNGQPHVHIDFWNVNQQIGINYVNAEKCDEIREKIEVETFIGIAEDLTLLDEEEDNAYITDNSDQARRALITKTFENEKNALHEAQNETIASIKDSIKDAASALCNIELIDDFAALADIIPKHGQIAYGYMPDDVKEKINEFAEKLINTYPQIRDLREEYINLKKAESEMYNSTESDIGRYNIQTAAGKANDKLNRDIGNIILKELKKYNFERRVSQNENLPKEFTVGAALKILDMLLGLCRSSRAAGVPRYHTHVDLSKAAKLELKYKHRDKEEGRER